MKNLNPISYTLLALLLASSGLAQTPDSQLGNNPGSNDLPNQIAVARRQYTTVDISCLDKLVKDKLDKDDAGQTNPAHGATVAQLPRRAPGPMRPSRRSSVGYPRAPYPHTWVSQGSPVHALIGAAIGFGLGAVIAARGNAGGGAMLALGAIGGGIGAGIGFSVPSFPAHYPQRDPWPDEDEMASRSKPHSPRPAASTPPAGN